MSQGRSLTIDELVDRARSKLERVAPEDLEAEMADGALVVDIRPQAQRERDGEIPGAAVFERNVLEWRLAPSSKFRSVELTQGQRVIVVCNEGFQSSLAAATLQDLGVSGATDLAGGFQAWVAVG
jgi:rhodanese-related sulfurtransferase